MREEVLRLEGVTYWEQGVPQLEDVHLSIRVGEVLGLLPVRGHGLTALSHLLQGNLPLKYGYIYYREELINSWRSPAPKQNRIGVIQSTSSLVEGLTVAENIFVLRGGARSFLVRPRLLRRQLQPFLDEIEVDIKANAYVEELSTFQRFVVELVKAVVTGCHLVMLRDISTFISESELTRLHKILRYYAGRGMSFLYIGYHFEELALVCGRTAMMIDGRITKIIVGKDTPPSSSADYEGKMRRELSRQGESGGTSACRFQMKEVSGGALQKLSFSAKAGECIVLQDLDNRIFDSLLGILVGAVPAEQGGMWMNGNPFVPSYDRQLAIIREDPTHTMLFSEMSYLDNLCFTLDHRLPEMWYSRKVQEGLKRAYADMVDEGLFWVKPIHLSRRQKYDLIYHRILLQAPQVVFCIQPFKGADMELRMHIWELLEELMERGIAVVILAVNLSDALALSHQLIRIHHDGSCECYHRNEFAKVPFAAPWVRFIQSSDQEE